MAVPLSSTRKSTLKTAPVQSRRNPTTLLLSPKLSVPPFRWPSSPGTPGFNALTVVPPIGFKRDVAKLHTTAAKLSDLEPRNTTNTIDSAQRLTIDQLALRTKLQRDYSSFEHLGIYSFSDRA
ncbi:hypothetical protein AVEN_99013-1 [Araneus ventricosus]|uniref:Uncharacterized protein n=1 Tax=Araneus ventricosus TaxID=182803 RepID=A0A4Y2G7K4_ARAVE|nr:hypothetical protein AVEN_99013-1 [Araneus ventricosus]